MKILGLLGGTSWHSTIEYYKQINAAVNTHFGDNTNPPLLLFNMNQSLIHKYQNENNWARIAEMFIKGGERLQKAGAEKLMFCANTPHKVYKEVSDHLSIPIIHIADVAARTIQQRGINKVLFLGTKYTMVDNFVTRRIADHNIEVFTPSESKEISELHRIIQEELTYGNVVPTSKEYVLEVIQSFLDKGVEGVVLGCTEFPLMITDEDLEIPVFNTTEIHAAAGARYILEGLDCGIKTMMDI